MPTLILRRAKPLTAAEASRLPPACHIPDEDDVVARVDVEAPLAELLALAAAMGRAVPDARFEAHVPASAASVDGLDVEALTAEDIGAALVPASEEAPEASAEDFASLDPWELLDQGDVNRSLARFQLGWKLESEDRDRIFRMARHPDPAKNAIALHIARHTDYKSFIMHARRLVQSEDARVREAAALAIGALGGPSQEPLLEKIRDEDKVPAVRKAAQVGLDDIASRQR
ncbi:MAG: HEAT repeat domain-containing protein [Alphaproteobacteria bacterium]|nr:HEAT repeat domain-containing protein [Alphaproteobacteria bacterium]